jgi:beta-fructofuranosidase
MAFRLEDKWVWDFWFAQDEPDYHMFYLQAPRAVKEAEQRHWHASIGHAVSQDLKNWRVLPDALRPSIGDEKAFDSYATWTGSIIRDRGIWCMFYTGNNKAEQGRIQRIGLATSSDLIGWQKHASNPLIEVDSRWYEPLNLAVYHEQAWRDPWIFWHAGTFHALITGRANHGPIYHLS